MNGTGKQAIGRLGVTSAAAALVALAAIVAAVLSVGPAASRAPVARATVPGTRAASGPQRTQGTAGTQAADGTLAKSAVRGPVPGASGAAAAGGGAPSAAAPSATAPGATAPGATAPGAASKASPAGSAAAPGAVSLVLTAVDHRDCPAGATACVDLTRHITWLQASGKVTFGPVQMEPGKPGGGHETPRGTFHVAWKAGAVYESTTYHEPMPWATFFAAGGIAFHGGPLAEWSHGCVHLTDSNAHYYNEHLPIGAEVVVF